MFPLAQAQPPQQLPDLPAGPSLQHVRGPIEIPEVFPWSTALLLILGAVLLVLVTYTLWTRRLRQRSTSALQAPDEEAHEALSQLSSIGNSSDFAQQLSRTVRHYLSRSLQRDFTAKTAGECLNDLPANFPTGPMVLEQWFQQIEAAGFAGKDLSKDDRSVLVDTARQLINNHQAQMKGAEVE
ncbi:DUF4381 family protein [Coraliomargarita akajimensis]|uniref:DUF4381 domain-containing protein n=1 Tax=Coraliomargarita akajimensis (strain DSM 45221 / IAM 15411 / JCM 23193 / KCTC 12865 / 04OKA010-24) TaxID=583355 RepID=D5EQ34_CORAD|nr:DUF4381 family protein [Coraliomargarita akajimensis]ADE53802.1 hypothetical protein Caka_0778 [Coraliomargarita akajimensis DSM 45221]